MMKIQPLNDKPLYTMGGVVVDIDIYANKKIEDIPDTQYNKQVLYYLKNQERYHKELLETCEKIVKSGSAYSDDIGYIYGRMLQMADPNYVWRNNNDSEFSNYMIDIKVIRDVPVNIGSKSTGRYGDKGVVSEIVDDDKMPFTADGRPLDVIVNPLSCPNRLNPFQWMEISFNHSSNKVVEDMKKMKSNTERFKYLCKYLKYFNERGELDQLIDYYKALDTKGKKEFWEDIFTDGIYLN
jgi:DNA-directed RNA polymerase beta subunit